MTIPTRTAGIALAVALTTPLFAATATADTAPPEGTRTTPTAGADPAATAEPAATPEATATPEPTATPASVASAASKASSASKATARANAATSSKAKHRKQRLSFGERTIRVASEFQGVPYRSGGTSPRGFDCSGFVRYVFAKLDRSLPRSSQEQFNAIDHVRHPQIGDLIFFHNGRSGSVYHVAIYAGNGKIWHSTRPGGEVSKTKIYTRYWTAGRI